MHRAQTIWWHPGRPQACIDPIPALRASCTWMRHQPQTAASGGSIAAEAMAAEPIDAVVRAEIVLIAGRGAVTVRIGCF
jgi:hypothetical protein